MRRVVITGMGSLAPNGHSTQEMWDNLINGVSGIARFTKVNPDLYSSKVGGEIKNYDSKEFGLPSKEARKMALFTQYAVVTASEAMREAGLTEFADPHRVTCQMGNGIGGIEALEEAYINVIAPGGGDTSKIYPLIIPKIIMNEGPANVAIRYGIKGLVSTVVTACSSGCDAIGNAYRQIKDGYYDAAIAGGSEAPISALGVGGFIKLQALCSSYNDMPEAASRPFSADRAGFILSEGAGMLVMEEYEAAKKRGANILVEVAGYGVTCDAHHLTAPYEDGREGIKALEMALQEAKIAPDKIGYINAHGTATRLNDAMETSVIKSVFGAHAPKIAISSTKSMMGHTLGAAGALETVITAKVLQTQVAPPTINLNTPDPECDLDYVPNTARDVSCDYALTQSFGFGGHNSVLILKKV